LNAHLTFRRTLETLESPSVQSYAPRVSAGTSTTLGVVC
jgi:hypothetical protein